MQEGGEVVVALSEGGKLDAPGLCRTASSPCDADGERIEQSKTGDARNEIVKALILYSRTKKKTRTGQATHTWSVRGGKNSNVKNGLLCPHNNEIWSLIFIVRYRKCPSHVSHSPSTTTAMAEHTDLASAPPKRTKIVLLGDQSVGKTSLITRCVVPPCCTEPLCSTT